MDRLPEAQALARATYNAAADHYDHTANGFWERFGRRTIERLRLPRAARVLDVCCGSGASALAAAEAVGSSGRVVGVDLAENLLELARAKTAARGLDNLTFRTGDMLSLESLGGGFDAVVCVFGVFFAPDMSEAVRSLSRARRAGGVLAITTWGPNTFEPVNTAFWEAVRRVRPSLYKAFNPWERLCTPQAVSEVFTHAGIRGVEIETEAGMHTLESAADSWALVMGSGYRGTVEQLDEQERDAVRRAVEWRLGTGIVEVKTGVVYGVGR